MNSRPFAFLAMTVSPPDLNRHALLARLTATLPGVPGCGSLHLVGGSVRDAVLGCLAADFDVASEHDPTPLAQIYARVCGGQWFWLDEERRQSRVITRIGTCDFAPWRAATLEGDLAARDYTINAMALDLAAPLTLDHLIDPLGGRADLARRTLRMAGPGVLHADPLRILKGIRHAAELALHIEPATLDAMREAAPDLQAVAPERLRLETWRILGAPDGGLGLGLLAATAAGTLLFGPRFATALPACLAAHQRARQLFAALPPRPQELANLLTVPVEQGLDRQGLLLWHECLRQVAPGLPLRLARHWRFSRMAVRRLAALAALQPASWDQLIRLPQRLRPLALWAEQYGPDPCDLLLALAMQQQEPTACLPQLHQWLAALSTVDHRHPLPTLVDGAWLSEHLALDGPGIGATLAALCQAEMRGEVVTVADARGFAAAWAAEKGLTSSRAVPIIPPCSRE